MRPWPEAIAKLYPVSKWAVAERPWWTTQDGSYVRSDGFAVPRFIGGGGWQGPDTSTPMLIDVVLAAWDKKAPLPHPGFRVGQLWCWFAEGKPVIFTIDHYLRGCFLDSLGIEVHEDSMQARYAGAYLIADAACPWLAPWSYAVAASGAA